MSIQQELGNQRKPIVVSLRNNPGIPNETLAQLTEMGLGVLDYETEESLKADNDGGATRSFETLIRLSAAGGYGVSHTEGFDNVVVGQIPSPAMMFLELEDASGDNRRFKAFQFDKYASINLDDFPDLHELLANRSHLHTLNEVNPREKTAEGNPGREAVTDAFVQLKLAGNLQHRH